MVVFYTNRFIPKRFAGYTVGFVILIRPTYRDDLGLLEHEMFHVYQFISPRWWFKSKLEWEVAAYKEQLKWYSDDRSHLFAGFISTKYGFNISEDDAYKLLTL